MEQAQDGKELLPQTADENPTVALTAQIDAVMMAFISGGNPTAELQKLDQCFAAAEGTDAIVETTARRLFQQSNAFDNLNFQSSLISNGSPFFQAVLRKMGELVEAEPELGEEAGLPVHIRMTEHFRRGGSEEGMDKYAKLVELELADKVDTNDPLALAQLAKVRYEQSMMAFSKKDFEEAIRIGEDSIALCERANDKFGVLAARGNTAGLFRYNWADSLPAEDPKHDELLDEGKEMLRKDTITATMKTIEQGAPLGQQQKYSRVAMNNTCHLMQIADRQNDLKAAQTLMGILWANPTYLSAFDPNHPKDPEHAQDWAKPYPAILARLEKLA